VAAIYSGTGGYLDRIKVERVREFQQEMIQRLHSEHADLIKQINEGQWDDQIEEALGKAIAEAIDDFGPDFDEEGQPLEEGESDRIKDEERRIQAAQRELSSADHEEEDAENETEGSPASAGEPADQANPVGGV
jgi:F-type H+/Na+-transporting ATPase subunit alpha